MPDVTVCRIRVVRSEGHSEKVSHSGPPVLGPSADMPLRPDFVKLLILRDIELGQTG